MVRSLRFFGLISCLLLPLLLGGCLLVSGEQTTIDMLEDSGNLSTSFVGADGSEDRTVRVGDVPAEIQVIVMVSIESGDLGVELRQPDGTLAFAVSSKPDAQVTYSGMVRSDDTGLVRYRVSAYSARNGSYQIFFLPQKRTGN
jgi:hypothetical protein